jgi:hypothetical protein
LSHGPGRIQRAVLDELERVTVANTFQLAASAYGVSEVTDAQIVATRRALRNLAKAGRVFEMTGYRDGKVWGNERYGVHCRIQVLLSHDDNPFFTDKQIARHEAVKAELLARAEKLGVDINKAWPCSWSHVCADPPHFARLAAMSREASPE